MPQFMRWSVVIDADLSKLSHIRQQFIHKAYTDFGCHATWRKDRNSAENGLRMKIPYRLSVRGPHAQACMQWMIEELVSEHADAVDLEDIWSTPVPEQDQRIVVQQVLEQTIIKSYPSDPLPIGHVGAELVLRPAPDVQPGLVRRLLKARRQKAGLTANDDQTTADQGGRLDRPAGESSSSTSSSDIDCKREGEEKDAPQEHPQPKKADAEVVQGFERALNLAAIAIHDELHWEYQELLKDHRGVTLREVLEKGEDVPDEIKSSDVHQMIDDCHVCLCVTTFKRDFQLREVLALNVAQTWPWRRRVTWCIFDPNSETGLLEWVGEHFRVALQTGHIIWLRAETPWETFHCSVAKNTAHMQGVLTNVTDRLMTITEAGLTATVADLDAKTFVMNWDNDNVLSLRWLYECLRAANHIISTTNLIGYQWQNTNIGTCGRIGTSYEIFKKMGGYDESMLAMGVQDVDLVRRMALIGSMEWRSGSTSFTVSNRPEEAKRLLSASSAKQKRAEKGKENDEKLKWLPEYEKSLGSFAKICDHNGRIMKLRAQNKIWTVNEGKSIGVSVLRMTISPRLTLDGYEVRWPAVEILNPDPDPQAGFDRHGSSSSAPQPAPASEHTIWLGTK